MAGPTLRKSNLKAFCPRYSILQLANHDSLEQLFLVAYHSSPASGAERAGAEGAVWLLQAAPGIASSRFLDPYVLRDADID
jgi:hypothetical protein